MKPSESAESDYYILFNIYFILASRYKEASYNMKTDVHHRTQNQNRK